jgi:DNA/RNA-binding domain of Phe-tRNA-synthetase-like protein
MSLSQIEGGERNVMQVIPSVAPKIYKRHPDFHLVSITLRNALVQVDDSPALFNLLAEAEASVLLDDAGRDAHLAAWVDAYRGFGAKPNRTPCSAAALLKRTRKDGALPRISPVVDAYNAISVLHGIPVGGEDLAHYRGSPRLFVATGDEAFDTAQDGQSVTETPDAGEIVWCDDQGVTCRRWNWRQGRRTMITAKSTSFWLVLEALGPVAPERLNRAAAQLTKVIASLCPDVEIASTYLDRSTVTTLA